MTHQLLVLAQQSSDGSAFGTLIGQLIGLALLLLLVYVLLDLARTFMQDVPPVVNQAHELLGRIWEPVLRPIRSVLPNMGGLDFSPIIVLILLQIIRSLALSI